MRNPSATLDLLNFQELGEHRYHWVTLRKLKRNLSTDSAILDMVCDSIRGEVWH
jgi:hypothetical protein